MKRSSFAWALALVAMVFGLFALAAPAPTLALDTGPGNIITPAIEFESQPLHLAILNVGTVDQETSTKAFDHATASAIVAERIEVTDHPDPVRLWRDPGNQAASITAANIVTDSPARAPDKT